MICRSLIQAIACCELTSWSCCALSVSLVDQFWRYHGLHFAVGCVLGTVGVILAQLQRWKGHSLHLVLIGQVLAALALGQLPMEVAGFAIVTLALSEDLRFGSPLVLPMASVSSVGVWLAVPDTEAPILLMGLLCAYSLGSTATRLRPPSRYLPILALGLAAVFSSAGLPAVVGGVGCLGVLPFLAMSPPKVSLRVGLLVTHLGAVAISSRIVTGLGWGNAARLQGLLSLMCFVAYRITTRDHPGRRAGHEAVL